MSGSESRPKASDPPKVTRIREKDILKAEPAVDAARVGEPIGFDPRSSFYPQTLLKAEDLRVSMPRPGKPRYVRYLKVLVAIVLAIGVGLAYVFFLSAPATGPAARDTAAGPAKEARSSAAAVGTITVPAGSIPPPAIVAPAKPAATATQAAVAPSPVAPSPVAPPPVASVRRPAPASVPSRSAPQPPPPYATRPAAGPRATVTHTKAAVEAADGVKGVPPQAASPAAAVVAPAAAAKDSRAGGCSEALVALGLCNAAARGDGK